MQTRNSPVPALASQRRILLCAIGMSPQIVTETLYALAARPAPGQVPWAPTEVHIITTAVGAENARLSLLSGQPGWFHQLRRDFNLPAIAFGEDTIHVIRDPSDMPLEDIRTPEDNEAAANQIAALVRNLTSETETSVHASLAGGRKTMSYYLGYALSLFGRPQDRLSHVLVTHEFEAHPDFFYPTPYERVIHTRDAHPRAIDCANAQVQLAEIPFLRLRDALPAPLLSKEEIRFGDAVRRADLAVQAARVEIDTRNRTLRVNGETLRLSPTNFALYVWLARRHKAGAGSFDPGDFEQARDFLTFVEELFDNIGGDDKRMRDAIEANIRSDSPKDMRNYFASPLSRLKKDFENKLGIFLARRCGVQVVDDAHHTVYCLPDDLIVVG